MDSGKQDGTVNNISAWNEHSLYKEKNMNLWEAEQIFMKISEQYK